MVYAYRLKDRNSKEQGRVIEGFAVRHTWQFTSDAKVAVLKKWDAVLLLEAGDITALKKEADARDKEAKEDAAGGSNTAHSEISGNSPAAQGSSQFADLESLPLAELKDYAKAHGFDEAEYSKLTRSKLVEYIVLGMRGKDNA
jgi:hypothetical protein